MNWIKRGAMLVVGLAIIGAIAWGFAPKPVAVDMADAMAKSILITIDEEGITRVKDRFTVRCPVPAPLHALHSNPAIPSSTARRLPCCVRYAQRCLMPANSPRRGPGSTRPRPVRNR